MKKLNHTIAKGLMLLTLPLTGAVGGGLVSCDTIEPDDRWTTEVPVEMKKNVLIEDFTGQKCKNCPTAADLITQLKATSMGEHIVAVSIHGGSLAIKAADQNNGLATPLGEEYNKRWSIESWPNGLIDRGSYDGNDFKVGRAIANTAWTANIISRLALDLAVDIDLRPTYDTDTRQLTVNVDAIARTATLDGCQLNVWLTESNIIAPQTLPSGEEALIYRHNHVLRESLTEAYGIALPADGHVSLTHTIPASYTINGRPAAKPENMAIVAFVTAPDGQVLQVVDQPIIPAAE